MTRPMRMAAFLAAGLALSITARRAFAGEAPPRFSPDSKRILYWGNPGSRIGSMGEYVGGKWFIVVDGDTTSDWADADYFTAPAWSPDGRVVAAMVQKTRGTFQILWGIRTSSEYRLCDHPVLGPGKRVAWAAVADAHWAVYVDGPRVSPAGVHAGMPVFGPGGKGLAWVIQKDGLQAVVMGGRPAGKAYDHVHPPVFHPKGREVAFAANRGGAREGALPAMPGGPSSPPVLTRPRWDDVVGGEWFLVQRGRETGPFELGWTDADKIRTDRDLQPLRDRPDFKNVVEALSARTPEGK